MKNKNQIIEDILEVHKNKLGTDFEKYRNHAMRVFALCKNLDTSVIHDEKYAIAAAFHDLGIWTANTFDYLEPSIVLATKYLERSNKLEWVDEITTMIDMHHKRSKYKGAYRNTVETFRKADWIDVSMGIMNFSLAKGNYFKIKKQYPYLGFHQFLIVESVKYFFKAPLNPLPMFKK